MAAAWQGLPVRLDRAPQRGAAFAITRASRRARMRSPSRARGSSLIFDHPPAWRCGSNIPPNIAKKTAVVWLLRVTQGSSSEENSIPATTATETARPMVSRGLDGERQLRTGLRQDWDRPD